MEEEDWEEDDEPSSSIAAGSYLDAEASLGDAGGGKRLETNFSVERAEDFLIADDPAMFSDEFSDPEDWTLNS